MLLHWIETLNMIQLGHSITCHSPPSHQLPIIPQPTTAWEAAWQVFLSPAASLGQRSEFGASHVGACSGELCSATSSARAWRTDSSCRNTSANLTERNSPRNLGWKIPRWVIIPLYCSSRVETKTYFLSECVHFSWLQIRLIFYTQLNKIFVREK